MKTIATLVFAAAAVTLAAPASAQFAKPQDAIQYRKSAFFVMQQNFAPVFAMAAGKVPFDPDVAREKAAVADFMAKIAWAGFVDGTDTGDTRAKPEIWKEPARFKAYADKTQTEMTKLAVAARTGSLERIRTAARATAITCKNCHDDYRKD